MSCDPCAATPQERTPLRTDFAHSGTETKVDKTAQGALNLETPKRRAPPPLIDDRSWVNPALFQDPSGGLFAADMQERSENSTTLSCYQVFLRLFNRCSGRNENTE